MMSLRTLGAFRTKYRTAALEASVSFVKRDRLAMGLVALASAVAIPAASAPASADTRGITAACPAHGVITTWFGGAHQGVDIANSIGTPIYAALPGTVIASGAADGYGQWIRIRHQDGWIGEYGHMNRRHVGVGAWVNAGQHIADMGNQGVATGPHLHFEINKEFDTHAAIDPVPYLRPHGVGFPC